MTTKVTASVLADTSVTPGTYGGSTVNSVLTVDQQGRITYAGNTTPSYSANQLTGYITSSQITNIANTQITGLITSAQIASVANTQVTGLITSAQIATVANTQITGVITSAQIASGSVGSSQLATLNGTSSSPAIKILNLAETANIFASAPISITNYYISSGDIQYYTSNTTTNFTLNLSFSSGTSLNTAMSVGDTISTTLMVTNGSTAYYPSTITIDGVSVTPKWISGTSVSSGNINAIDVYTFAIIKTASSTYTVLATQAYFK